MGKRFLVSDSRQKHILKLIMIVAIMVISCWKLGCFDQIMVLNDEFGYWSIGANIAGKDWSNLASQAPYYSYGYSFLLAPLFLIFHNAEVMYKAAILMNMAMLVGIFLLAFRLAKKINQDIDERLLLLISFVITLYPSNIVQVHVAWTEIYLCFLYWIIGNLVYDVIEEDKLWQVISLAVLSIYSYMIHQRALGILAAVVLVILVLKVCQRINWKHFFIFFAILVLGVALQGLIKEHFLSSIFQNNDLVANNDYSGQVGKFVLLFSKDGIIYFIQSVLGKAYYLGVSTFLLIYWGVGTSIKGCFIGLIKWIKTKVSPDQEELFLFFAVCSFAATFMITAIFTLAPGRIDTLIYGRYNEFSIGIILMIGIVAFWRSEIRVRLQGICFLILCVCAQVTDTALRALDNASFAMINSIGVSGFFYNNENPANTAYIGVVFTAVISVLLIFILGQKEKRGVRKLGLLLIAVCWFIIGQNVVENLLVFMQDDQSKNITSLTDSIKQENSQAPIYYLKSNDNKDVNVEYFQFLLPDTVVYSINYDDLSKFELEDESYLLFLNTDKNIHKMQGEYRIIGQSPEYVLMTKAGNQIDRNFKTEDLTLEIDPLKCSSTNRDEEISDQMISSGEKGYLITGKYLSLSAGTYELTLDMRLHYTEDTSLGYIDVTRSKHGERITRTKLKYTDFSEDNTSSRKIVFSCNNSYLDVDFRLYTQKGVRLEVTGISIRKISNQYMAGNDTKKEIQNYTNLIEDIGVEGIISYYSENKALQTGYTFDYLEQAWGQSNIECKDYEELMNTVKSGQTQYVIMEKPADIFEYQFLLEEFTILDSGKCYLFLVNKDSNAVENSIRAGYSTLSDSGAVKLNYYSKNKGSILQNSESFMLRKGSYEVEVELNIIKASGDKIGRVSVYYNDDVLNSRDVMAEDVKNNKLYLAFPVSSFYDMGKVTVGVSNASGAEFTVEKISLRKTSENYRLDVEKGIKIQEGDNGQIEVITAAIPMTTGQYVAKYTLSLQDKMNEVVQGKVFVRGAEVISEPVKIRGDREQIVVEVPFEIGFDIITLQDLHTQVRFGVESECEWKIESIEIKEAQKEGE